jgi:hypothetical protein
MSAATSRRLARAIAMLAAAALTAVAWIADARADKQTVCTITVNSPNEKDTLRAALPTDKFEFVELVERGRADWLASACTRGVRCDVLVISGHYDGGNEFFSERVDAREFLPVDEMERVSCGQSCPGLFSQLKEVYLFGCNTLNAGAMKSASAEVGRSLLRAGHSRADADRLMRTLGTQHGESSRDRMRLIFKDVPAIYGFSSVAPLGPAAASILGRYLQTGGAAEVGRGRQSTKLINQFAGHSLAVTSGITDADPQAAIRRDVCQFTDDRMQAGERAAFIHALFNRDMAEVRMFFDRIERYAAGLTEADRGLPAVVAMVEDRAARARFIEFARDADQPSVRARMIAVAGDLGWLTRDEQRAELAKMFGELLANDSVSPATVDLVCTLNQGSDLDGIRASLPPPSSRMRAAAGAAIEACLGAPDGRSRMIAALTSSDAEDVLFAQVYFRHRPLDDIDELRLVTQAIARMAGAAQLRALETLARHPLSDPQSMEALAQLYPAAESSRVQAAIAGVLIRSDYQKIARPELVESLRQHRLKSAGGEDLIDVLLRRLQVRL